MDTWSYKPNPKVHCDVRKFQHVWTCLNRFSLWDFFPLAHLGFFLIWHLKRIGWWDMLEHPAHEQNSSHEGKPLECGWSEIGREGKQGKQNPNDMDGSWSRLHLVSTGFSPVLVMLCNVYFFLLQAILSSLYLLSLGGASPSFVHVHEAANNWTLSWNSESKLRSGSFVSGIAPMHAL